MIMEIPKFNFPKHLKTFIKLGILYGNFIQYEITACENKKYFK